jgi:hypothetical protein
MTKQAIIEKTIRLLNQLPDDKAEEISDFADFIFKKYEESLISEGIQQLSSDSKTFEFLKEEEELYSLKDIKVKYNG